MIQVHLDYLEAGADIIISSSYQVLRFSFLFSFCYASDDKVS